VTAPIVTADHVSKWYGQVIGLNDVSVSVPAGITGLLGPNGAGKSTFMKLITGQLKPSKGDVKVLGEPIWGNPHLFFQIGFCPEQDAFYERMTGLEWITALVRLNGLADKAADEAARRLHEIESMTGNILLINNGRILAEGDVHHIRDLIDEHPHTVYVRADDPRALAREFLSRDDVRSLKFEPGAVVVETGKPDLFYARLTEMAASGEFGSIDEVTSPDDNLQAVFQYLVK
jgi:ABC-type multidrug transport system ATPase subunit